MKNDEQMETSDDVVVATPALVPLRPNRYGSIPDLPDEELASPEELERLVFLREWGPVLDLPVRGGNPIKPNIDEYFGVDLGAFATVDFERTMSQPNRARYRVEKLKEERRDVLITLEMVKRRVPGRAKYKVLEYVRKGILDLGDILSFDMYQLALLDLRVRRLANEIAWSEQAIREREQKAVEVMFGRW
jgi:hypothetical protein